MKQMVGWCYYCERRLEWRRAKREWHAQTPMMTTRKGEPVRLWATQCPLSVNGLHEPVPDRDDVARRESGRT